MTAHNQVLASTLIAAIPPTIAAGAAVADTIGVNVRWETIIVAVIAAAPGAIAAIAALRQSRQTHQIVNSRMTELLEIARKEASAQATLDEKAAEQQRKGDAAIDRENAADPPERSNK